MSFLEKLVLHLILPIAIVISVKIAQLLVELSQKPIKSQTLQTLKAARTSVADQCIIFMVTMMYPGVCRRIFQVFRCHNMSSIEEIRLQYDYSIECWKGDHLKAAGLAILGIVFFAIGFPCGMIFGMWKNRNSLHNESHPNHQYTRRRFGFLYTSYEPDYWWWEIVIMAQKCILTSILAIVFPRSPVQLFLALLVSMSYMALVLRAGPYIGDHEDILSFLASTSLSMTMLAGMTKITDTEARKTASADGLISENALGTLLIVINLAPLVYFIIINMKRLFSCKCLRIHRCGKSSLQEFALTSTRKHRDSAFSKVSTVKLVPTSVARRHLTPHTSDSVIVPLPSVNRAEELLSMHEEHEKNLARSFKIRKNRSIRKTQMRVTARRKVKSSRALSQVPAFSKLSDTSINKIVDQMSLQYFSAGSVLCREGETADRMFIIVSGTCNITSSKARELKLRNPIATLSTFDIVGESMMRENPRARVRNATVVANSTLQEPLNQGNGNSDVNRQSKTDSGVQVLVLGRSKYEYLVQSSIISDEVVNAVRSIDTTRQQDNKGVFARYYNTMHGRKSSQGQNQMEYLTKKAIPSWNPGQKNMILRAVHHHRKGYSSEEIPQNTLFDSSQVESGENLTMHQTSVELEEENLWPH